MNKDINKINNDLIDFWDKSISSADFSDEEIDVNNYNELAPSEKLANAIKIFKDSKHILDYGCGYGWASIIASFETSAEIDAVDMSEGIIESLKRLSKLYNKDKAINAFKIDSNWLSRVPSNSYDAIIINNVLDVIPMETSLSIIKELPRILKPNSKILIGMNFYLDKEVAKKRGMELDENNYLFVNGILRLVSKSDEEWTNIFNKYFVIEKIEYFAWSGETKETRRLFYLRLKK